MKKIRRPIDIFSLSFLDVVSCGFGAIILLPALGAFIIKVKPKAQCIDN